MKTLLTVVLENIVIFHKNVPHINIIGLLFLMNILKISQVLVSIIDRSNPHQTKEHFPVLLLHY